MLPPELNVTNFRLERDGNPVPAQFRKVDLGTFCGGDGRLGVTRRFAIHKMDPPKGRKSLRFWLHFVTNPVQIGAVTSPQSMLSPLEVEWI
jgi:hypothetical protein